MENNIKSDRRREEEKNTEAINQVKPGQYYKLSKTYLLYENDVMENKDILVEDNCEIKREERIIKVNKKNNEREDSTKVLEKDDRNREEANVLPITLEVEWKYMNMQINVIQKVSRPKNE